MKKLNLFLALMLGIFTYAQDYSFDRLIQYEENDDGLIQIYFNSKNDAYYLQLKADKDGEHAEIYDRNSGRIHYFNVTPVQEINGLIYEYKYDESKNLPKTNAAESGLQYEFKTKRDDKYYQFSDLNLFHANQETPFLTADLALRYSEENLFNAFNLCCLLGFDQWNAIKTQSDFVVVKANITDEKGEIHQYRLIDDQVVQFKLRANDK